MLNNIINILFLNVKVNIEYMYFVYKIYYIYCIFFGTIIINFFIIYD